MNSEPRQHPSIAFIGCGNMGSSLIAGLINGGFPAASIRGAEPDSTKRQTLRSQYAIEVHADNPSAIRQADVIVLALKPQILLETLRPLADKLSKHSLVISLAAGIRCQHLAACLPDNCAIVRAMPNTPALINLGASGLYANQQVTTQHKLWAEMIIQSVGIACWVSDEALIDVITAVSGSGPAYYFLFMELFETIAVEMGLNQAQASALVRQTALGAASMAAKDPTLQQLRRQVTSPGGTTEAAVQSLLEGDIAQLFKQALTAAVQRSQQLSEQFGEASA